MHNIRLTIVEDTAVLMKVHTSPGVQEGINIESVPYKQGDPLPLVRLYELACIEGCGIEITPETIASTWDQFLDDYPVVVPVEDELPS